MATIEERLSLLMGFFRLGEGRQGAGGNAPRHDDVDDDVDVAGKKRSRRMRVAGTRRARCWPN